MNKKNTILILSLAVVFFGVIAYLITTGGFSSFNREINKIKKQSSSDEIEAIEKDLQATDLSDIDKELEDIENELEAAY